MNNTTTSDILVSVADVFGLGSIATSILSVPALGNWLRIALIGAVYEACRQLDILSLSGLYDRFWITAIFTEDDISYAWIMYWLSRQPSWSDTRQVEVYTRSLSALVNGSDQEDDRDRKVTYIPSMRSTYNLWYQGCFTSVCRDEVSSRGLRSTLGRVSVRILSRNKRVLDDLVAEAREQYMESRKDKITVYVADSYSRWSEAGSRPKRPLQSVILEPGLKDLLVGDAQDFLASHDWYAERGIPFRRGFLLYGAPGSGKTSMIQAIAGELGLDVYIISLCRAGMDDAALNKLIAEIPTRSIALMEDIDAAFSHTVRRSNVDTGRSTKGEPKAPGTADENENESKGDEEEKATRSSVTLSGLLNALDGIGAQEGRILFATTNRYHVLDPALCRPGRMDVHIEFKLASKYQAAELFKAFYRPSSSKPKPQAADKDARQDVAKEAQTEKVAPSSYKGELLSARTPLLAPDEAQTLAEKFAEAVPEQELSMASLQGYLMSYKTRPREAAENAAAWVEGQLQNRR